METLYLNKTAELKRTKEKLEKVFNLKITIIGKKVTLDGDTLDEYEATQVIDAINFGFPTEKALLMREPDYAFRKVHIKEFTKRPLEDGSKRIFNRQLYNAQ